MNEKKKNIFKIIACVWLVLILIVAILCLYILWTQSYYVSNHPCYVCSKESGATVYLNEVAYKWNEEKQGVERWKSYIGKVESNVEDLDVDLDAFFEGLK